MDDLETLRYVIIPDVFVPTEAHLKICRGLRYHKIFNSDGKRAQASTQGKLQDVVVPVTAAVLAVMPGLKTTAANVLRSLPGCVQQEFHTDYPPNTSYPRAADGPVGIIAAFQASTHISTPAGDVPIPPGSVLVFAADFVHAGSAYDEENHRLHLYGMVAGKRRAPRNSTYLLAPAPPTKRQRALLAHTRK
jgi:hypothetical protein